MAGVPASESHPEGHEHSEAPGATPGRASAVTLHEGRDVHAGHSHRVERGGYYRAVGILVVLGLLAAAVFAAVALVRRRRARAFVPCPRCLHFRSPREAVCPRCGEDAGEASAGRRP